MLNIYTDIENCVKELPKDYIDLSKVTSMELVNKLETIYNHHKDVDIYLGFLDPILMLTSQMEVRIRKVFRKFEIFMIVGNPFILPFSWKNGMRKLVIRQWHQNVDNPETLHDGSAS